MKPISKKVYISILTFILVLTTTITSSYAWIQINKYGFIDKLTLDIAGGDGMSISLDGTSFKSRLSSLEVKEAVLKKCDPNYSPGMSENEIEAAFSRIELAPITSVDDPQTLDKNELFDKFESIDGKSTSRKYLALDVYVNTNVTEYPIEIYFGNTDMITSIPKTAEIFNSLPTENLPSCFGNSIPTKLKVSAANAARIGIVTYEVMDDSYLNPNPSIIAKSVYYIGSQVPSLTNEVYNFGGIDASYNANLLYYDMMMKTNIKNSFPTNRKDDILNCNNIIDSSYGLVKNKIAKFTIYVWLEGWDADCFNVVSSQIMNIEFKFASYRQK